MKTRIRYKKQPDGAELSDPITTALGPVQFEVNGDSGVVRFADSNQTKTVSFAGGNVKAKLAFRKWAVENGAPLTVEKKPRGSNESWQTSWELSVGANQLNVGSKK